MRDNARFRVRKAALSWVLALSLAFSMAAPAFASQPSGGGALEDDLAKQINYVSLGDSMSNGYGLKGYDGNNGVYDYGDESYANQFASWLAETSGATVNHSQLAMSAMRAEDLHWLLEFDYADPAAIAVTDGEWDEGAWNAQFTTGDYWTFDSLCDDYRFATAATYILARQGDAAAQAAIAADLETEYVSTGEAAIVAKEYQEAVTDADVISMGMGNGNFGVFMMHRIMEAVGFDGQPADSMIFKIENAIQEYPVEVQEAIYQLIDRLYAEIEDYLGIQVDDGDETVTTAFESLVNTVVYTCVSFVAAYHGSIDAILTLNPDAEIILVGLMNTFVDPADDTTDYFSVGDLLSVVYRPLNAYIAGLPVVLQATGKADQAKFYYAKPGDVECMLETYGSDFYQEDGTPNANSVIRKRFVTDIVGTQGDLGTIWGLLDGVELMEGVTLTPVTLDEIIAYQQMSDAQKAAYATQDTQKALSVAVYLAFEDAVIASSHGAPVSVESILGLGNVDASLFAGVMADFMATVGDADALTMLLMLPDALSASLQKDDTVSGLLGLFSRNLVGNGLGGHPSAAGHDQLFQVVKSVYESGYTVMDQTVQNLKDTFAAIQDYVTENYELLRQCVRDYVGDAVSGGYVLDEGSRYVAIGDATLASNASYADLLADELEAMAAERGVEFSAESQYQKLAMTDEDGVTTSADLLAALESGAWDEVLAGADLVSVSVGQENLTTAVSEQLEKAVKEYINATATGRAYESVDASDWAGILGSEGASYIDGIVEKIASTLAEDLGNPIAAGLLTDVMEVYAYGYVSFATACGGVIDAVQAKAPEAQVVVVGLNNVFDGLVLTLGEVQVDLGSYAEYVIQAADLQLLAYAADDAEGNVTFVSAPAADTDIDSVIVGLMNAVAENDLLALGRAFVAFQKAESWMPTDEGHAYIADQVLAALTVITAGSEAVYAADNTAVPQVIATVGGAAAKVSVTADSVEVGQTTATVSGDGFTVKVPVDIKHYATAGLFTDFKEDHWYLDENQGAFEGLQTLYMDYALATGLMSGIKNADGTVTRFGPWEGLDRAQAATIIYRMVVEDSSATMDESKYADNDTPLSDVRNGQYYTAAVNWCVEQGIITGYQSGPYAGKFMPYKKVTRQELATMIQRCVYACADESFALPCLDLVGEFDDADEVDYSWAYSGLNFCLLTGVMSGVHGTNDLNPTGTADRAQAAKMFSVVGHDLLG